MPSSHDIYLEVGQRRIFAGAIEWPGWCRTGRDEDGAVEALAEYGRRYAAAVGRARRGFKPPRDVRSLKVVERVKGNATTDFGAPGVAPVADDRPLDEAEAKRLLSLLKASWAAFDNRVKAHSGARLRKGPRGGGRTLTAIVAHVLDAEKAYLSRLGGMYEKPSRATAEMAAVHDAYIEALMIRAAGGEAPKPRRSGKLWSPRYAVRRSAWHALDHAWEIEDRATP
jgi:hypothetical protein